MDPQTKAFYAIASDRARQKLQRSAELGRLEPRLHGQAQRILPSVDTSDRSPAGIAKAKATARVRRKLERSAALSLTHPSQHPVTLSMTGVPSRQSQAPSAGLQAQPLSSSPPTLGTPVPRLGASFQANQKATNLAGSPPQTRLERKLQRSALLSQTPPSQHPVTLSMTGATASTGSSVNMGARHPELSALTTPQLSPTAAQSRSNTSVEAIRSATNLRSARQASPAIRPEAAPEPDLQHHVEVNVSRTGPRLERRFPPQQPRRQPTGLPRDTAYRRVYDAPALPPTTPPLGDVVVTGAYVEYNGSEPVVFFPTATRAQVSVAVEEISKWRKTFVWAADGQFDSYSYEGSSPDIDLRYSLEQRTICRVQLDWTDPDTGLPEQYVLEAPASEGGGSPTWTTVATYTYTNDPRPITKTSSTPTQYRLTIDQYDGTTWTNGVYTSDWYDEYPYVQEYDQQGQWRARATDGTKTEDHYFETEPAYKVFEYVNQLPRDPFQPTDSGANDGPEPRPRPKPWQPGPGDILPPGWGPSPEEYIPPGAGPGPDDQDTLYPPPVSEGDPLPLPPGSWPPPGLEGIGGQGGPGDPESDITTTCTTDPLTGQMSCTSQGGAPESDLVTTCSLDSAGQMSCTVGISSEAQPAPDQDSYAPPSWLIPTIAAAITGGTAGLNVGSKFTPIPFDDIAIGALSHPAVQAALIAAASRAGYDLARLIDNWGNQITQSPELDLPPVTVFPPAQGPRESDVEVFPTEPRPELEWLLEQFDGQLQDGTLGQLPPYPTNPELDGDIQRRQREAANERALQDALQELLHQPLLTDEDNTANPAWLLPRQTPIEMTNSRVDRYARRMRKEGGYSFPPIQVVEIGGELVIYDGHHRAAAARKTGIRRVPIERVEISKEEEIEFLRQVGEAAEYNRRPPF